MPDIRLNSQLSENTFNTLDQSDDPNVADVDFKHVLESDGNRYGVLTVPDMNKDSWSTDAKKDFNRFTNSFFAWSQANKSKLKPEYQTSIDTFIAELKNINQTLQTFIIKPLTDGEAVDFGDGLNEYIGQYDTSDWNNDVFHMQMFKIGSGELYRVEITFDVDGTSDTDWESGAKWIILLNPKADKLDRVVYLGLDPCTGTANGGTNYSNDRVGGSDGHFEILDDVPHTVVAKNGFVSTDIEMQAHNQKYPSQKIEYDSTDQVTIYNISNPPLTASLAFHYKASPWFSYNTDEYVTGPIIKARLMSILNEISETSPDNNPFKIVWMRTTNLNLIPTINSNQRSDAVAVEAPTEVAAGAAETAPAEVGEAASADNTTPINDGRE